MPVTGCVRCIRGFTRPTTAMSTRRRWRAWRSTALGEVEVRLHHTHDTEDTLRALITKTLDEFRLHGLLMQLGDPPGEGFGFIHGDWALDSSYGGGEFCGVDSESFAAGRAGLLGRSHLAFRRALPGAQDQLHCIEAIDDLKRPKVPTTGGADARTGAPRELGLPGDAGAARHELGERRVIPSSRTQSLTTSNT